MGSIGEVMFHVVGIAVLVLIAITIAAISVPRRPRAKAHHRELVRLVPRDAGRGV